MQAILLSTIYPSNIIIYYTLFLKRIKTFEGSNSLKKKDREKGDFTTPPNSSPCA